MIPSVYSVGDGLTLRVCRTEKFKVGMLTVSAVLPIRRENVWMTSLLLSVLRRGTEIYPTLAELNRRLDYLYGTEFSIRNFYRGDDQIIGFSADLLDEAYLPAGEDLIAGVLELMCQILFHPLLDEKGLLLERYVESEKLLQCDAIRATQSNPRTYAEERFRDIFYAKEPCGAAIYGTEADVMAISAERLTAYWHELTAQITPDCFYVGNANPMAVRAALKASLGAELGARRGTHPALPPLIRHRAERLTRTEEDYPSSQGQLIIGFRTGCTISDRGYYACVVCNELFGVSPVAKLFMNVRERLSLCYSCSSNYDPYKGVLVVRCALASENRERAEEEIFRQLALIADGGFDDGELEAAKRSLENAYRQVDDSPATLESFYFGRVTAGVNDSPEHCRACFAAVTREDVIAAAAQWTPDTVYFLRGTLPGDDGEEDANEDD